MRLIQGLCWEEGGVRMEGLGRIGGVLRERGLKAGKSLHHTKYKQLMPGTNYFLTYFGTYNHS